MVEKKTVIINQGIGNTLETKLFYDNGRYVTDLTINGVKYHFEQMPAEEFKSLYVVDRDPDYKPRVDKDGMCFLIAPLPK